MILTLTFTMHSWSWTAPIPQMTPALGTSPYSMPSPACIDISKKGDPSSKMRAILSRGNTFLFRRTWTELPFSPPPANANCFDLSYDSRAAATTGSAGGEESCCTAAGKDTWGKTAVEASRRDAPRRNTGPMARRENIFKCQDFESLWKCRLRNIIKSLSSLSKEMPRTERKIRENRKMDSTYHHSKNRIVRLVTLCVRW